MKYRRPTIDRLALGKLPVFCRTEIEALTDSMVCPLEINQKWRLQEPSPETSIHNLVRGVIEPLIFPKNRRLYSNLAIGAFGQESAASSFFGCGIFALAARRRLTPASSAKPSRRAVLDSLPHENEIFRFYLHDN